jgi:hypothetical protein
MRKSADLVSQDEAIAGLGGINSLRQTRGGSEMRVGMSPLKQLGT